MLELAILGFLKEEELHGYELKQRIAMLTGYYRRVSDGALYPAIARLEHQGKLARREEGGTGAAPRQMLPLPPTGEANLLERLRDPAANDISDRNRFFTLLAFLISDAARTSRSTHPSSEVPGRRAQFLSRGRETGLYCQPARYLPPRDARNRPRNLQGRKRLVTIDYSRITEGIS
jgi:DNA-binding PadR family transcriptional regulator